MCGVQRGSEAWHQARGTKLFDGPWFARKRFIIPAALGLIVVGSRWPNTRQQQTSPAPSLSSAGLEKAEQPMCFEECNRTIRSSADQLRITPSNIVDSNAMRIVRFSG